METKQILKDVFSKNLIMYLDKKKKSQADLCNDLKITSSTVSDWVNAKKYPRMDKVQMIADYFGIRKSDLTDEHNDEYQTFTNVDDAMLFIIQNPTVAAFGGYDVERMSDEDKIEFANQISDTIKFFGQRYGK